ncbi:MAG: Zn-dependent hydrolase, partial [Meiothermus sp.]
MADLEALTRRVLSACADLARMSEEPGRITRTFLSPPMRQVHAYLKEWMERLGMSVWVDPIGNLRGYYPANKPTAPRLLLGSHLDTVPNGGAYDGALGVVLAIAVLEALGGRRLGYGVEVIGFSEEEGVRFGVPFLGSRALVGRADATLLALKDAQGVSVAQAVRDFGLEPEHVREAALQGEVLGYLEFHIEQGPVLESLEYPLGLVEAIVGQSRLEVSFRGKANHAGTTPVHLRRDALAGAAEWIGLVEREAWGEPGLVATVGQIQALPGAGNVIPGEVRCSLDVRHTFDEVRTRSVAHLVTRAQQVAQRRGLELALA